MKRVSLLLALAIFSISAMAQYNRVPLEPVCNDRALTISEKSTSSSSYNKNVKASDDEIAPFWSEDFENGLPATWENTDASGAGGWILTDSTYAAAYTWTAHDPRYNNPDAEGAVGDHIYGINAVEGNKFLHLPGDAYNTIIDANGNLTGKPADELSEVDGTIMTDWIDITGHENIALRFDTWFRLYTGGKFDVSISTDGNNWETFNARMINGVEVGYNDSPQSITERGNVTKFQTNISEYLQGATQLKIQFRFYGTTHYYVSIDKIELFEPHANDIKIADTYASNGRIYTTSSTYSDGTSGIYLGYNVNYSEVPYNIINQLHLGAYLIQNGVEANNARLQMKVDSMGTQIATYPSTTSIPSYTYLTGDTIMYSDTANNFENGFVLYNRDLEAEVFTANNKALMKDGIEYVINYEALSDNEDMIPENNTAMMPYAQTQGRYSYHHKPTKNEDAQWDDLLSNKGWNFDKATGDAILNDFDIYSDDAFKIYGVRVYITTSTDYNTYDESGSGVTIVPIVYYYDQTAEEWIKLSDITDLENPLILTEANKGTYVYLPFIEEEVDNFEFLNGSYRIGFQIEDYNIEAGEEKAFSIGVDNSVRQAWGHMTYLAGDFKRLGLNGSLMIDAYTTKAQFEYDKEHSVGIKHVKTSATSNVKVYPNPTNGMINIKNAENASIEVYTITGTLVKSIDNAALNTKLNLSNLAKGTYLVKIVKENNVVTKKVNLLK